MHIFLRYKLAVGVDERGNQERDLECEIER